MRRFLNWVREGFRARRTPARPRAVRPWLEPLDDRLVPAATSAMTTTHGWFWSPWQTHDFFAIDQAAGQVVDFQTTSLGQHSRHALGGPGNVRAVSASVDPATGFAEVFAETWDFSLWRCD